MPIEEFDLKYSGAYILLTPGDEFKPEGKRKSVLDFARKRLKGAKSAIIFVALMTVIGSLFEMMNPAFSV